MKDEETSSLDYKGVHFDVHHNKNDLEGEPNTQSLVQIDMIPLSDVQGMCDYTVYDETLNGTKYQYDTFIEVLQSGDCSGVDVLLKVRPEQN